MSLTSAFASASHRGRASGAGRLRLLILAVSDRCDQRCVHCQIWMGGETPGRNLRREERLALVDEALVAGAREALLTGGEPLLSSDLWPVAKRLRTGGARLMLATNGMLLERHAAEVGRLFSEVYVSLDGAEASTHDGLRGVPAFSRVAAGVAALRDAAPAVTIVARSTLHAGNVHEVEGIVATARSMGFHHVSFLALDASSGAFGGRAASREALVPSVEQVDAFDAAIERLRLAGLLDHGFVFESREKLRRLGSHLRASGGHGAFERPECDAPWWSSVVEADGAVRPCFFHEPVGDARDGLVKLRSSEAYRTALEVIASPNGTCERCVCPKWRGQGLLERIGL